MLRIEPGVAGLEASVLPLCYAAPHHLESLLFQIYFTRNGKVIGKKEVRIPKGGFYPTVGMMSCEEKVRVDLRPLSG